MNIGADAESMRSECFLCCDSSLDNAASTSTHIRAERATLVICKWKLRHYPHVADFIDKIGDMNLRVDHTFVTGAKPELRLYDGGDDIIETISISSWNVNDIVSFLRDRFAADE